MANKQQVIDLHEKYPAFTSKQIASLILGESATDCDRLVKTDGWVRATAQRNGLNLAKVPRRPRKPHADSIFALGRACRAAGFTVADIREIADID